MVRQTGLSVQVNLITMHNPGSFTMKGVSKESLERIAAGLQRHLLAVLLENGLRGHFNADVHLDKRGE